MSLPKMTTAVDNISQLDDLPNAVGGLSAAELKARFDKAGGDIKTFLNETLIPAIEALGLVEEAARNQAIQAAIDALELDTTVENLQKAIAAAETRAKEYADTKDAANLTAAKEYADSKATAAQDAAAENAAAEADAALAAAKSYADTKAAAALAEAERVSGADADNAEAAAKTYADTKDAANLQAAKEYTDGEIPVKLPNPQKLKFTGAVSGEYDGSEEKTINIPAGGGSAELPEVLENLGAATQDAAAGSIPVAAGDAAWALRKLIEAYTGDEGELSGYIPSTAWVDALLSAAAVRYDKEQYITDRQKRTARLNIGARISKGTYWSGTTHTSDAIAAAQSGELYIWGGMTTPPVTGITGPTLMIPGDASHGNISIAVLDATGAWYTGTINLSTSETSLTKVSAPLPVSVAADAGKLLQVGADGKAKWGDKLPTALKNPAALTFTGAATGTYDGSEALTITIPEGGSGGSTGGGLRKMSAVSGYLGIPATELPTDGTIWMCISSGDNAELYSGTITIEGGEISTNNLIAVSNGSVIQLNQAAIVSAGFAIYGMPAADYVGVWQEVGVGSAGISTDLYLGMNSATVGQIAKISAVDDNGVPLAWTPVDMPSGGGGSEKPLSLIASYDFTDNTAAVFEETELDNLTELIFLPTNVTNATEISSGLSLRINDFDVAATFVPIAKQGTNTAAAGEPWEVCRYNGVFWECLICNEKSGPAGVNVARSYAILNNHAIRNVGPATKMKLYIPNPIYKPTTGTLEVWGR